MKKLVAAALTILIVSLAAASVCYAGDVPEGLLSTDGAQLYFAKVLESTDDKLTVLPIKAVMGDIELNKAITYTKGFHGTKARVGKTYLFGYVDENNVYFWVTDSMDPKTLKIKDVNSMTKRLQKYLNNGDYERVEAARLKKAATASNSTATEAPTIAPTPATSTNSVLSTSAATSTQISQTSSPEVTEQTVAAAAKTSGSTPGTQLEPSVTLLIGAVIIALAVASIVVFRKAQRR